MAPFSSSIIDNRDDNTLLARFQEMGKGGQELCIATAFFSLDALLLLAPALAFYERVRILFGDDADAKQRARLLQMLRQTSDDDLLVQREALPHLSPLKQVEALFAQGRIEARCYTAKKFHAKAYLMTRPAYPYQDGVIGSGNFTRPGLLQNIELNVKLSPEQTDQLAQWFEARWAEAQADVVTNEVLAEVRRQIELYEPYVLYLKALFMWGREQQDDAAPRRLAGSGDALIWNDLDAHQDQGFRQALKILERQHGVMVCDGVGLGKSFVALALMETFCRDGKNVLLLAPKNILTSSWNGYLKKYLARYRAPFGSIHEMPMTELGFDADDDADDERETVRRRTEELHRLAERADVIIVDESHNFRTTSAARYKNLFRLVAPEVRKGRKKIVLLTATPINTAYRDLAAQLSLITHDEGAIGGYNAHQIRRFAAEMDKGNVPVTRALGQLSLGLIEGSDAALNRVLENVVIQRSRKTCKALSEARGKTLRFPTRRDPETVEYTLDGANAYRDLIALTDRRFRPGVEFIRQMRAELEKAEKKGVVPHPVKLMKNAPRGLKLAAFLTEQYRRKPAAGRKQYQDEVHLAALVFSNTLKQLESSPPAFQGIVQSLGIGLIARLHHVLGDAAEPCIAPHQAWVRTPLFPRPEKENARDDEEAADPDLADTGDALDASGGEVDEWLEKVIADRQLAKKLRGFDDETFEVERWKSDLVADLDFLREIHTATIIASQQPDPKLADVAPRVADVLERENRVLVFTQSQRTAEYLEKELKARLGARAGIARIDSRVETTRAAILSAFCPGYNPPAFAPSVPARVDVLISTDVLSEGVNLQEAHLILNYDIHWNPVRLIQRIGRVDRRLKPDTPEGHGFAILNVLPPPEIETIIGLVGAVENRTLKISRALGLDVSFFKSDDPAGNLIEFNSQYDGTITPLDHALTRYVHLTTAEPPDEKTRQLLEAIPPGALGVWKGAPQNGLFALFTLEPTKKATDADRARFASVVGRPVLALERPGAGPLFDAGEILALLEGTTPGEPSGTPSDETELAARLKKLKDAARNRFRDINLPATIAPRLVCWVELQKGDS